MSPVGVRYIDHTADVGMDVDAPTLDALFHSAAVGMLELLRGHEDGAGDVAPGEAPAGGSAEAVAPGAPVEAAEPAETATVELAADALPRLLGDWLRELLYLHEVRALDYAAARFDRLDHRRLLARVTLTPGGAAEREIKGVTYHELEAGPSGDGWRARVIFDV